MEEIKKEGGGKRGEKEKGPPFKVRKKTKKEAEGKIKREYFNKGISRRLCYLFLICEQICMNQPGKTAQQLKREFRVKYSQDPTFAKIYLIGMYKHMFSEQKEVWKTLNRAN